MARFLWLAALAPLAAWCSAQRSVVVAFLGRSDVVPEAYSDLLDEIRRQGQQKNLQIILAPSRGSFQEMEPGVQKLLAQHSGASVVYMGHGMGDGGASAAQHYASSRSGSVVLLAGFLERSWRPEIVQCAKTWEIQPTVRCPKGLCPGGYLKDGVHNCSGPAVPSPSYPLPTLSIGGELDGVVRVTRLAEAWYTQRDLQQHQVKLVMGMSHSDLISSDSIPSSVAGRDLPSECGPSNARSQVATLVVDFLNGDRTQQPLEEFFEPFVELFVKQEGSWWWTSHSDELGSSRWAATAQQRLVEPLGASCAWRGAEDAQRNEFRMLSDEELIPPYYRTKHRPNITGSNTSGLDSITVAQLRYVELSVLQVAAGLNGWAVIKEEKAGVLADRKWAIKDDGNLPTSAIEIASKLASRELAFKVCGLETSPSLDDGDRCKSINQEAYDLALKMSSPSALRRFQRMGRPLVMAADRKPTPPAGPWWIWSYLSFTEKSSEVEVASWYAFYPLSGPAYGAGNHYCKLLSPARALEWIYVDGLRKANSTVSVMV